ncbi:MAG: M48 family metallopeptidase, partial [Thermodesulfobacteriota bacterium]|nr:M48 family metallopeptidase [Thermodesulfobacteriota bacterium]
MSPTLTVYLIVFLTGVATESVLTKMNISHLKDHGHTVPDLFKGYIDGNKLRTITDYTVQNERFGLFTSWIGSGLFLFLLLSGLLPWFVTSIQGLGLGALATGMVFFATLAVIQGVFSLPFSYYKTFVIEQRYGFNTATFRTWVSDIVKAVVVGAIIGGILLAVILLLVEHGGSLWWLWAWLVFFGFQLLLLVLFPTLIAPWFNKFLPLEDEDLEEKVRRIMRQGGLAVEGVFKMDAGKRSRHTNAYFTGVGRAKRIVLFDTLLTSHSHDEIVAILAHEVGHWKRRHLHKHLLFVSLASLLLFFAASRLLKWPTMYQTFGFDHALSYVGLFLVGVLWDVVGQFLRPIGSALSRQFEKEADAYAAEVLTHTADLKRAL